MATIHVPYSKTGMDLNIEDKNLLKVLTSKAHDFKPDKNESQLVEDSMDNPIGSKKLEELAVGKKNIVIITSDHTRPVPSKITMPIILRRIRSVNKDAKIKILIANGFHRPTTKEELIFKMGEEIVENEEIVMQIKRKNDKKIVTEELILDKKTLKPTKLSIMDNSKNVMVYILYNEIELK